MCVCCTGLDPQTPRSKGTAAYLFSVLRFLNDNVSDRYIYASIRTNKRLGKNGKKTKKAPAAGRRRENGLGRYLQGREGRAR